MGHRPYLMYIMVRLEKVANYMHIRRWVMLRNPMDFVNVSKGTAIWQGRTEF